MNSELISKANAWDAVWSKLKDHPLIVKTAKEHAKHGNCSCACIVIDAFNEAYENNEGDSNE